MTPDRWTRQCRGSLLLVASPSCLCFCGNSHRSPTSFTYLVEKLMATRRLFWSLSRGAYHAGRSHRRGVRWLSMRKKPRIGLVTAVAFGLMVALFVVLVASAAKASEPHLDRASESVEGAVAELEEE